MKVLQIYNTLGRGGVENLIYNYVPLMEKKGVEVDILCLKTSKTIKRNESNRIKGNIIELEKSSFYSPLWIFTIIPHLKNYDIVHAHLFPTLYWVVLAKLFSFSKVPIIYTEHSTSNRRRNSGLFKIFDKYIYRKISVVVCIIELAYLKLKEHLGDIKIDYEVIENGINLKKFNEAVGYPKSKFFEGDSFVLIQVSSFGHAKDQQTAIRSLTQLPDNVKLLLVGAGKFEKECRQLSRELNVSERVQFLGFRNDVPKLTKTADVIILSSHYEGLSLAIIEGMAAHKPFIGSEVQGITEVVSGYGLLFEEGNEKQLAQLVTKLTSDSDFYQSIANRCLKRSQDFDVEKMVSKYIKLYEKVNC